MRSFYLVAIASLLVASTQLAAADQTKTIKSADERTTILTWGPAHQPPAQAQPDFDQLDRDGDGMLSLVETEAHRLLHSDFDYADLNSDGQLSRAELARWVAQP